MTPAFIDDAFNCLMRLNPALRRADLMAAHVARLKYAQPICPPGFARAIAAGRNGNLRFANRRYLFLLP
ncbi:MAG: hypothetical protein WDN04_00970 [Rhodospirillales bacterium]